MEAAATLEKLPGRFGVTAGDRLPHGRALARLRELAGQFERGGRAVGGLYLGLTDLIRTYSLAPEEVRPELKAAGFSEARVSEVLRVASAPEGVYREFSARVIGFKVALSKTRLFRLAGRGALRYRLRMARRAGVHLVKRLEALGEARWALEFGAWRVSAQREELNITNNAPKKPL